MEDNLKFHVNKETILINGIGFCSDCNKDIEAEEVYVESVDRIHYECPLCGKELCYVE
jgi:predicted RNA-binding Zn-ribbon protein involved in translation (DUF1610 family)